jgi:hypothetical protein
VDRLIKKILLTCLLNFVVLGSVNATDPTRPFTAKSSKVVSKVSQKATTRQPLTAIFVRNKRAMAMIEGRLYSKNDYYRGSRIIKILKDKVLLKSSDGNFQLTLIPQIKK